MLPVYVSDHKWQQKTKRNKQNNIANQIDPSYQPSLKTRQVRPDGFERDEIGRTVTGAAKIQHQIPYPDEWNIL